MSDDPKPDPEPTGDPEPDPKPDPKPDDAFDRARAMATIEKQRASEKELRRQLAEAKKAQEQLEALEAEKLSDLEKAQKRAEEAEKALADGQGKIRTAYLLAELAKPERGIASAQAAAKLIEGVEYDDDDKPSNLDDLLPGFLEANAFLVSGDPPKPKPPALDGREQDRRPDVNLTSEQLEAAAKFGMTPERYAQFSNGMTVEDVQKLADPQTT
jgi:hypothetical protein